MARSLFPGQLPDLLGRAQFIWRNIISQQTWASGKEEKHQRNCATGFFANTSQGLFGRQSHREIKIQKRLVLSSMRFQWESAKP
jgi:hypothetical protein